MGAAASILTALRKAGTLKGAAEDLGITLLELRKSLVYHSIEPHAREVLSQAKTKGEIRLLDKAIRERRAKCDQSSGRRREAHKKALAKLLEWREALAKLLERREALTSADR